MGKLTLMVSAEKKNPEDGDDDDDCINISLLGRSSSIVKLP